MSLLALLSLGNWELYYDTKSLISTVVRRSQPSLENDLYVKSSEGLCLKFRILTYLKTSCRLQLCQLANVVYYAAIGFVEGGRAWKGKGPKDKLMRLLGQVHLSAT